MTTNTVSTEISTQRTSRPYHYSLHRMSHISPSPGQEPPPLLPPTHRMDNTVRILSSLAPQLNVPQPPVRKAWSQSGRDTPSADIYSGILESRYPPRQSSGSTSSYNFSLLEHGHRRNTSSSSSQTSKERVRPPSTQPLKESTSFYDIAARALGVRRGRTQRKTSKSEARTISSGSDFDVRSFASDSAQRNLSVLGTSANNTSTFLNRPISYVDNQGRPSSVIDISHIPEGTKRKPRPPPLSVGPSSVSGSDDITPDSMITPASTDCPTARPWSNHSSSYATTPVSSVWPDQLSRDTTNGKIRLPLTGELFDSKNLPLLPPDDIPSPVPSASVSGEPLEPRNPIPPKMLLLASNRRASMSLPGLSSNFTTGSAPDDTNCDTEKGSWLNSSRNNVSLSEREARAIMRKRGISDPPPPSFDPYIRDEYTRLPAPKLMLPIDISLGISFEQAQDVASDALAEPRNSRCEPPPDLKQNQQHDPILRYTSHGTDVLDISRPSVKGSGDDVEDGASCVESHYHPTIDGMSDTESNCAVSIYSSDSELPPDLNSVLEEGLSEENDVARSRRVSEMRFRPASASSSDTFTQKQISPISMRASSGSTTWRPLSLSPFAYAVGGGDSTTVVMSDVQQVVGERRADKRHEQDWIGEWNEPNMQQVINKLRALRA